MKLFRKSNKHELEGYNIEHLVIELEDIKHLTSQEQGQLLALTEKIRQAKATEGKKEKIHIVVDSDKEYIDKIKRIIKLHGDWGKRTNK